MAGSRSAALALAVALAAAPLAAQDLGSEQQRENGKQLYGKYCSQCHGDAGDGQGYATSRVKPEPRDFTSGKYKFRTTPSGRLPTDADVARVIRVGLPYTSMPAWPNLSESQIRDVVYYLKTFSSDFENPDMYAEPIAIPQPLASTEESIVRGREIYGELGCAACHGDQGRGDGPSAPTLTDDWGDHIRAADLTKRWTFRGGASKRDIFRTFSTGLNGTPMPSYADSLEVEDRLHLVNYIYSLGDGDEPGYASLVVAEFIEDELDLNAEAETIAGLFEGAAPARFPLIGQIVEPGRNFYPSADSVDVQAIYNRKEIAVRVSWNDMRAETSGHNSPLLEVPLWDEELAAVGGGEESGDDDSFFGDAEGGEEDFFGGLEEEEPAGDFFGELEADEEGADDFWDMGDDGGGAPTGGDSEFSDAVAVQFPSVLPTGNRKPYFVFGDTQNRVDLWFADLALGLGEVWNGRGSEALEASEVDEVEVVSKYEAGTWSVIFKRELRSAGGIAFEANQFTPIAFSVWDGFNRERGNRRALSSWFYVYTEPEEEVSAAGPMLRIALLVLVAELLVVFLIRRRGAASTAAAPADGAVAQSGAAS